MNLPLQDFPTLVRTMAAGVQGASSALLDLTVGSVLRAILEANAAIALWMQWLIVQLLATTRAATSNGADLDSWMADFSLVRLPGTAAGGVVSFARFSPGLATLIPAGTPVRTADGSQSFTVAADPAHPAWNAAANGYAVAAAAPSIDLPVTATVPGAAGNVQPGGITLLAAAIPGIDTVVNNGPFAGGVDAESDAGLRGRFQAWTASLSRATPTAIRNAVASVQQGLACVIAEGTDAAGQPRPGHFVVTVDDGTGHPPASLISAVIDAVEATRPVGTSFAVQPPVVVPVAVSLAIEAAGTLALAGPVAAAIAGWIDALPIGATLPLTRIAVLAYGASPAIGNVVQVTLNGAAADIVPPPNGVIKAGSVTVN